MTLLNDLQTRLEAGKNDILAEGMTRYMRNLHPFFGIKAPERVALLKAALKEHGLPAVDDLPALLQTLWNKPEREWHYTAMSIFERCVGKSPVEALDWVESLITQKSWWDTVDTLAPHVAGKLFLRYPDSIAPYTERWIESENIWLQRSAIIFQLTYKTRTDAPLLFAYCERRKDSKEFFVRKAIGWALRQYARVAPQSVRDFVEHTDLAPLSRREAMKHL